MARQYTVAQLQARAELAETEARRKSDQAARARRQLQAKLAADEQAVMEALGRAVCEAIGVRTAEEWEVWWKEQQADHPISICHVPTVEGWIERKGQERQEG